MTKTKIIATALEAAGVLGVSAGVAVLAIWGGIITFSIGLVVFGIALERDSA